MSRSQSHMLAYYRLASTLALLTSVFVVLCTSAQAAKTMSLIKKVLTYQECVTGCAMIGGTLASVESSTDFNSLVAFAKAGTSPILVAAIYNASVSGYVWQYGASTGTTFISCGSSATCIPSYCSLGVTSALCGPLLPFVVLSSVQVPVFGWISKFQLLVNMSWAGCACETSPTTTTTTTASPATEKATTTTTTTTQTAAATTTTTTTSTTTTVAATTTTAVPPSTQTSTYAGSSQVPTETVFSTTPSTPFATTTSMNPESTLPTSTGTFEPSTQAQAPASTSWNAVCAAPTAFNVAILRNGNCTLALDSQRFSTIVVDSDIGLVAGPAYYGSTADVAILFSLSSPYVWNTTTAGNAPALRSYWFASPSSLGTIREVIPVSDGGGRQLCVVLTPPSSSSGINVAADLKLSIGFQTVALGCATNSSETDRIAPIANGAAGDGTRTTSFALVIGAIPRTSLSTSTVTALTTLSVVNSISSASMGSPTAGLQQIRISGLLGLGECIYSDTTSLPPSDNPLGLAVGRSSGQYWRGAVTGAIVLMAACATGIVIITLLLTGYRMKCRSSLSVTTPSSISRSDTLRSMLITSAADIHSPGILVIPVVLGIQPVVAASCQLFQLDIVDASDICFGLFGIIGSTLCLLAAALVTSRWFDCRLVERGSITAFDRACGQTRAAEFLRWLFSSEKKWCDNSNAVRYKSHFMLLFGEYRFARYILFELCMSAFTGVILGIRNASRAACLAQTILLFLLNALYLAVALLFRPALSKINHFFMVIISTISCICALSSFGNVLSDSAVWGQVSDILSATMMVISDAKICADAILVLVFFVIFARHGGQSTRSGDMHKVEMDSLFSEGGDSDTTVQLQQRFLSELPHENDGHPPLSLDSSAAGTLPSNAQRNRVQDDFDVLL